MKRDGDTGSTAVPARRREIIQQYAEWTALSALRSGSPVKSREQIVTALRLVDWEVVLDYGRGQIDESEFQAWHRGAADKLECHFEGALSTGWVVKLLNVYLKTAVYVGDLGRAGLRGLLHPPIDGGLWKGLLCVPSLDPGIIRDTHCVTRIKDIKRYDTYLRVIRGCRAAALATGRGLFEVEEWWQP